MPILFLDFDGVLHPEHCHESRHFCCLPVLENALRQVPECKVVITSTWRLEKSYEDLLHRFSPDIAVIIDGVTPRYCDLANVPNTLVGVRARGGMRCLALGQQSPTLQLGGRG